MGSLFISAAMVDGMHDFHAMICREGVVLIMNV
jgi:hypothetical protein